MSGQRPAHETVSEEQAKRGDDEARKRDPHGTGPTQPAGADEPAGTPSSDRHNTETASGE